VTDIAPAGLAYAEVHRGIWIARCPRPYCDNAVALVLGTPFMVCAGDRDCCGLEAPVVWPNDPIAIAALLAMRPVPKTRNWLPHETIEDLIAENAQHDVLPPEWTESGRVIVARTADHVVTGGILGEVLPAGREIHQLGVS
jgi:hypothetical protein